MKKTEIKRLMLNAKSHKELVKLKELYRGEIETIWKTLKIAEKERIAEIAQTVTIPEVLEEVSCYLKSIGITNSKDRKQWVIERFKEKVKKELSFREILTNPEYDNFWVNLLLEIRAK